MNFGHRIKAIFDFAKPDRIPLVERGYWPGELVHVTEAPLMPGVDLRTAWGDGYWNKVRTWQIVNYFGAEWWIGQTALPLLHGILPLFEEELLEDKGDTVIVRDGTGVVVQRPKYGTAFLTVPCDAPSGLRGGGS